MKKKSKVSAAPYEGQDAPMEVHEGAGYSKDPQVHTPEVGDQAKDPQQTEETKSAVDIERNPKPEAKNPHDLTEPLKYVVSAPDAIEKIEGLLEKIAESMPALKPLVAEVKEKMNEMEALVLGEEYIAHEATEGEPQVEVEQRPEGARFASGDKVTVTLKDETYEGTLLDRNEDGTWEVQTDGYVALHRVPESDIQVGGKDSLMLPAAKKEMKMKALVAALEKLTNAVKADAGAEAEGEDRVRVHIGNKSWALSHEEAVDLFRELKETIGPMNDVEAAKKETKEKACHACGGKVVDGICEKCGQDVALGKSLHDMAKGFGAFGSKVEAKSAFDVVEELELGGGYIARKKKGKVEGGLKADGGMWRVNWLPSDGDEWLSDGGHLSRKDAERWAKAENIPNSADEWEVVPEGEEDAEKVEASAIDKKELELGDGYTVRKKKASNAEKKD